MAERRSNRGFEMTGPNPGVVHNISSSFLILTKAAECKTQKQWFGSAADRLFASCGESTLLVVLSGEHTPAALLVLLVSLETAAGEMVRCVITAQCLYCFHKQLCEHHRLFCVCSFFSDKQVCSLFQIYSLCHLLP